MHNNFKKKRVCFVSAFHESVIVGGAEYQAYIVSSALQKMGAEIFYISPNTNRPKDEIVHTDTSTVYFYKRCGTKKFGSNYFFNLVAVKHILQQIKPDIIYQRGLSSLTALFAWYAKRNGIPFVLALASDANITRLTIPAIFKTPLETLDTLIGRRGMGHANAVVVQTDRQGSTLKTRYKQGSVLIRNIYDTAVSPNNYASKKNQVVCHCKYNPNKSPATCIRLAELLPDIVFVVAGIDDKDKLAKYAGRKSIPPNLKLAGILPKNEFVKLVAESKILLSTSHVEGFPNTFIEAWMNKTAVVSLHVNPDNLLVPGKYGCHARHNIHTLTNIISRLTSNNEEFLNLTDKSYAFAKNEFSFAKNLNTLIGLFQ